MKPATTVVAIDASLTSSGVVWGSGVLQQMKLIKVKSKGPARLKAIRDQVKEILLEGERAGDLDETLVLIEGYAYGKGHQAHQIGELGGVLRLMFHEMSVATIEVGPTVVKKFATGKGNASKDLVLSSVTNRTGMVFSSNDLTDAMALYCIGRSMLGLQNPMGTLPSNHSAALEKLDLPLIWRERHSPR